MAKKSVIARERKRQRLVAKYKEERDRLRAIMKSPTATLEKKLEAQRRLQKLPKNSAPARLRNRCQITGRPRGYLRMFGVCRNLFRQLALEGKIPGVRKASW